MKIKTLLIANRGEIACRIARTARASGITPVGVHSQADANALHVREIGKSVCIGAGPASESYLKIDAVIAAAQSRMRSIPVTAFWPKTPILPARSKPPA